MNYLKLAAEYFINTNEFIKENIIETQKFGIKTMKNAQGFKE